MQKNVNIFKILKCQKIKKILLIIILIRKRYYKDYINLYYILYYIMKKDSKIFKYFSEIFQM